MPSQISEPAAWEALDATRDTDAPFGTGVALVDLGQDGLPELVLGNGNDMRAEPLTVWTHGAETASKPYEAGVAWHSSDLGYHGDLCVGDIDGDGDTDVGVVRPWDRARQDLANGGVDFYLNSGGTLAAAPSAAWSVAGYAPFGCDLGDFDGDGRLDLAVAVLWDGGGTFKGIGTLWSLLVERERAALRVYQNTSTGFAEAWRSEDREGYFSVSAEDVDGDGDLDLVAVGRHVRVFRGDGRTLEATAMFTSTESFLFPYGLDVVSWRSGAAAQAVVSSGCKLPMPVCRGRYMKWTLEPSAGARADWASDPVLQPGPLAVGDLDGDGLPELVGSSWGDTPVRAKREEGGGPLLVFKGLGSSFSRTPCLRSKEDFVGQMIAFGSVVPRAVFPETEVTTGRAGGTVVTLPRLSRRILAVRVGGQLRAGWAWTPEHAWVSVPGTVDGDRVEVEWDGASVSDVAIANWMGNRYGGALVYSQPPPISCGAPAPETVEESPSVVLSEEALDDYLTAGFRPGHPPEPPNGTPR